MVSDRTCFQCFDVRWKCSTWRLVNVILPCALQAKFLPFQSQSMRILSQKLDNPQPLNLIGQAIQFSQMDVSNFLNTLSRCSATY